MSDLLPKIPQNIVAQHLEPGFRHPALEGENTTLHQIFTALLKRRNPSHNLRIWNPIGLNEGALFLIEPLATGHFEYRNCSRHCNAEPPASPGHLPSESNGLDSASLPGYA